MAFASPFFVHKAAVLCFLLVELSVDRTSIGFAANKFRVMAFQIQLTNLFDELAVLVFLEVEFCFEAA